MDHRPGPFCCGQRQVQGILADNPDRGQGYFHRAGTIMGIEENKVRGDTFPGNNVLMRHSCQKPDLFSALEASCSLIADPFSKEFIGKGKSFLVLDDPVTV